MNSSISKAQLLYLRRQRARRAAVLAARILLLAGFLSLWEYCAGRGIIDSFIFSSPSKIALCFAGMARDGSIFRHMWVTLLETVTSFLLVTAVSMLAAVILWLCPRLSEVLDPYMVVLNSLPKSALAPLLIVWLGARTRTIIVAGMSVAVFGSILTLYTAFCGVDPEKLKLIRTLRGTRIQALTKAVIPSSIPALVSTMKVNIGLCLVGRYRGVPGSGKDSVSHHLRQPDVQARLAHHVHPPSVHHGPSSVRRDRSGGAALPAQKIAKEQPAYAQAALHIRLTSCSVPPRPRQAPPR